MGNFLQKTLFVDIYLHILFYNILTTGYCNFWQSDWFPTRGIWGNVPLLPYLGSPLITSLGHVHVHTCKVMFFQIINIPFSLSLFLPFSRGNLIAISCGEYIIKQLFHSISPDSISWNNCYIIVFGWVTETISNWLYFKTVSVFARSRKLVSWNTREHYQELNRNRQWIEGGLCIV